MQVDIPYGEENITIDISAPCEVLVPNEVQIRDQFEIIEQAIQNPIGKESFEDFAAKSDRLLVIVNDASRPTPTSVILEFLFSYLSSHSDVRFLVATGAHREPTEEENRFIFGRFYDDFKEVIFVHDARKEEDMTYLGTSKNGTEMYINKLVPEIRNVLIIGSVEPHYFAGFTGGRKSFLPGVASYKTIEMNHRLAFSDDARSLALDGNPVHEDMVDAMNVLENINIFSIQTVLTGDHKLYAVTAGDLLKTFDAAIEAAKTIYCVPLRQRANIVISVAPYPMDIDLYQSQKALDNGKLAVEDDGILIVVSKCRMGVGEAAFLDLLGSAGSCQDVLNILDEEYKLGYHKAAKMAQIGIRTQMWAVTDLDENIIKKAKLKPYSDIQSAVNDAIQLIKVKGKQPRIVIMPSGSLTIPYLNLNKK
ncbi:nickel-dependent lactate racemase [Candidatus Borrarchaeum sp.]|uniref:nickel-dependent lactate racemase n=1 Tax=Candidatus Borrarchaeum sp. TaxID=2846742 RepID=UPI00257A3B45|nr:nickel-dependent lactate racemase [Candidatus Borrarchaeum sp.]